MEIVKPGDYKKALNVLSNGGLVIFPTETSYGIGADATNEEAVKKLIIYKNRPEGKAISIAVSDIEMAEKYVELNNTAKNIYKSFLPGPVTVISKSKGKVSSLIEAENKTLGVRIPNYSLILKLINEFGKPITATSANLSGGKTPYKIEDILLNIGQNKKDLIDLIIDAGDLPKNPPSVVIDTTGEELVEIRKGRIDPRNTLLIKMLRLKAILKLESLEWNL